MKMCPVHKVLILFFGLLFFPSITLHADEAVPEATLTVELDSGAALLMGPIQDIEAVQTAILDGSSEPWTIERLRSIISDKSARLTAQYFIEADITGAGALRVELPLRRAVLTGLLPPVEMLSNDSVRAVLEAAGFLAVSPDEWRALSDAERIAAAARRPVAVISGTKPTDTVVIIHTDTVEHN